MRLSRHASADEPFLLKTQYPDGAWLVTDRAYRRDSLATQEFRDRNRLQRIPAPIDQEIRDALPRLDRIDGRPAEEPAKRSQLCAQRVSFRGRGQYLLCGEFDAAHRVINKSPRHVCVWIRRVFLH